MCINNMFKKIIIKFFYEVIYAVSVTKRKMDLFFDYLNNNCNENCDNNEYHFNYIYITNNSIKEYTTNKFINNEKLLYNLVIIKNSENKSILFLGNNDDFNELYKNLDNINTDLFKNFNNELLSYSIQYNNKEYDIILKDNNYNFNIVNNDIGNKIFLVWYLYYKYSINNINLDTFNPIIKIIDGDANFMNDMSCKSIILEENNYKIIN